MSGRSHLRDVPFHPIEDPRLRDRLPSAVAASNSRLQSNLLEDRIAIQRREIQSLLLDNQRLAAAHVALRQDLALAEQDVRHLSAAASEVKAEGDSQVREVYERSLKMEVEVRAIDAMSEELVQVRGDVQKLTVHRRELAAQLEAIDVELTKARKEALQVCEIKAEIENLKNEIKKGRAAVECEKKTKANNLEHKQTMEKNMMLVACEIEKLCPKLANAEQKARAAAAAAVAANPSPGYAGNYGNPEVTHRASPFPEPFGMHQVQTGTTPAPSFVAGAIPNGPFNVQQAHGHG